MRPAVRFAAGATLGGAVLAGYLYTVGTDTVVARATAVAPWALAAVVAFVVLEGVADGIGFWASVAPLNGGVSGPRSVQFALAGDFFDILSPAGPASSEPIMARFIGVATDTGYSEALGVRSVAKYVKSATQLVFSTGVALVVLLGVPRTSGVVSALALALAGLVGVGILLLALRRYISAAVVAVVTPLLGWLSGLVREEPYDRSVVAAAVDRFWERVTEFRGRPGLLGLIAVGGLLEQCLTAAALWTALVGVGEPTAFLPLLVVIPLPQVASVVPIPGSVGAYELLLGGVVVLVTGVAAGAATAAVLVLRTVALPFGAVAGGCCVAYLRGWRPRRG